MREFLSTLILSFSLHRYIWLHSADRCFAFSTLPLYFMLAASPFIIDLFTFHDHPYFATNMLGRWPKVVFIFHLSRLFTTDHSPFTNHISQPFSFNITSFHPLMFAYTFYVGGITFHNWPFTITLILLPTCWAAGPKWYSSFTFHDCSQRTIHHSLLIILNSSSHLKF